MLGVVASHFPLHKGLQTVLTVSAQVWSTKAVFPPGQPTSYPTHTYTEHPASGIYSAIVDNPCLLVKKSPGRNSQEYVFLKPSKSHLMNIIPHVEVGDPVAQRLC